MLRRLLPRRRSRRVATLNASTVQRSGDMAKKLERERARAERSGYALSLILMGLDEKPAKESPGLSKLIDVIEGRFRITDEAGEFDSCTAYVLLPDTVASGARHFAETIKSVMHRQGYGVSYAIYSYGQGSSSKSTSDRDDDSDRRGGQRSSPTPVVVSRRIPKQQSKRSAMPMAAEFSPEPTRCLKKVLARPLPMWKRVIDLLVAVPLLVLLWPLMVMIGIAIKLESKGPAVFRQQRTGLGGVPFWIYKYRTMVDGAEAIRDDLLHINEHKGPAFKIKNDPRITRLGSFLRKTSLDELPQLINVIRGDMTLVGPRPLPCYEADDCEEWQQRRVEVTPGLTCIWQVSGRSGIDFDDWVRMDLTYQRRRTLGHDLRILMATVPAVLAQRGAQ